MTEYEHPRGIDWWLASDGRWYPPQNRPTAGWWFASDGRWYPPLTQLPNGGWRYPSQEADRSRRTQMMAVASLISGLAGIFIMTAVVAIVLGIAVLRMASTSKDHRSTNTAMAIVGIVAGSFWLYLASTVNW